MSHHRSWNYGVSQPEVEAKTEPEGRENHGPGLENKTDSEREDSIVASTEAMHGMRRRRFSTDGGCMVAVGGGQVGAGNRRRAVSMSHQM